MALRALIIIASLCLCSGAAMQHQANPVRRVVTMLQAMTKKVTEEGEREQQLFDKFMCTCKTGGGDLTSSIESANTRIPQLESDIKGGDAQKTQLASDIKQHKADKAAAQTTMAESKAIREKDAASFAKTIAEQKADTAAMGKAIVSLEKGQTGFLQTGAATVLRRLVVSTDLSMEARDTLTAFLSTSSNSEDDDSYEPASGEISGILKQMQETMQKDMAEAAAGEAKSIQDFDALMAAKSKESEALTAAVEDKIARLGEAGVKLVNDKEDLDDTSTSLTKNTQFLADLDNSCKTRGAEHEARQKTRSEELTALAETVKLLNDDDSLELFKKTLPAASFLQLQVTSKQVISRARQALRASSGVRDFRLDLISMSMRGKAVDFSKVLGMVDDMVALLKKEQTSDNHKKAYCAKAFDDAEDEKKTLTRAEGDYEKTIENEKEDIESMVEEIGELRAGITALDKSVADSTAQRKAENSDYQETMAGNNAAVELIGMAKNRMNKFYNPKLYKAPPKRELSESDQIAVNMGGTAPPTAAPGGIAGTGITGFVQVSMHRQVEQKEAANGVIAMMDNLIADVQKEITEMKVEEKNAQEEYEEFMADSTSKRAGDAKSVAEKTAAKADTAAKLQRHHSELKTTRAELYSNAKATHNLGADCNWLVENFDVRKSARAGEVDSLTKAKAVLSGADYS